jgi:signal transduction histidine kinase
MHRLRDRLTVALVVVVALGVALGVTALLAQAQRNGVNALEESLRAEISAAAGQENQRVSSSLSNSNNLIDPDAWDFGVASAHDAELLAPIETILRASRNGFFLVRADGVITQGFRLERSDLLGTRYRNPAWEKIVASAKFRRGTGALLPVGTGLTTRVPTLSYVFPVISGRTGELRGSFVYETPVTADAAFNKEIAQLRRGRTGEYLFYDDRGTVIAANDPELLARRLPARYLTAPFGVHHFDDKVVAIASVPAAGWRIAFRQDRSEFEHGLVGPLQDAGRVVVVLLVAVAAIMVVFLMHRLRTAREEQRRLAQLAESQEEFISIVSHELRTPVAGVVGFLESSLDHWDSMSDEERRRAVRRAASNAGRLQALTRDVLDTRRLESGELSYAFGTVDLAEELRAAVETAREVFDSRTFTYEPGPESVIVRADEDRLQQVFLNLLDNAVKNAPADRPIDVTLTAAAGEAVVAVHDLGPGIEASSLDRIFDKFVRGRSASVAGTGLGLYISRRIVEAHGGRIWAESRPGEGATLRVALPVEELVPTGTRVQ